jgi:ornithine cyclodeaminase/alanine dehydrogenase-like protein (mu-crystallin family)
VLERCNVIVTATTTKTPLITKAQVRPGMLLCALGSFELEPEIYRSADKLFVDDWSQTEGAHDIAPMLKAGVFGQERLTAELAEVVVQRAPGRQSPDEVIIVRTEGLASQDIALAHWAFREAERRGMLQTLDL